MIDLHGQISFAFLKKSRFTGSFQGMRYLLQKQERESHEGEASAETKTVLEAVIWPEEGLWEAVDWLNKEFEEGHF